MVPTLESIMYVKSGSYDHEEIRLMTEEELSESGKKLRLEVIEKYGIDPDALYNFRAYGRIQSRDNEVYDDGTDWDELYLEDPEGGRTIDIEHPDHMLVFTPESGMPKGHDLIYMAETWIDENNIGDWDY